MRLWIHSTENSGFSRVVRNGNIYKIEEKMKQYVNVSVQEKLACLSLKWIIVSLNHCDIYIPMDIFKRMAALFSRVYIMMILEITIFLNLFILRMKSSMCVKVLHNLEWTKENCILQTLVERK